MSNYRVIIDPSAQTEQAIAFCEANGLNAREIPSDDGLRIYGNEIRWRKVEVYSAEGVITGPWQTVPLLSPPWSHGLASREVVEADEIAAVLAEALAHMGDDESVAEHLAPVVQGIIANEVSR